MKRSIIPILLLATVALSTGVVLLPRLKPLQLSPGPVNDQPQDQPPACEVLREMYHNNEFTGPNGEAIDWKSFNFEDNKQYQYKEYVSKRQDWSENENSFHDSLYSSTELFSQHQDYETNFHQPTKYGNQAEQEHEIEPANVEVIYARNKDVLIRDDNAYYVYDTEVTTTNPIEYVKNKFNCLNKARAQPRYDMPPDTENIETLDEPDNEKFNEVPAVTQVVGKRFDASDVGEKEIPDNLEFNDGDNGFQKKLFSFWSRLQALSHKGRQLPTRRHSFMYYANDATRDGALTAETRASSHIRPPGQPLRWG